MSRLSLGEASACEEVSLPQGTNAPLVLIMSIINKFKNILKLKLITIKNYNMKTLT